MTDASALAVTRLRHPLKRRLLEVARVKRVTPHLKRVTLTGDDLADFVSASFDDHVKVFFPRPGETKPALGEGDEKPIMRDFTPRRFDAAARELDLEFVLHHPGPASQWAETAAPGQWLGIGGPRGSFVIPTGFDWHWLIGDDSALPAIARRLEELPEGAKATAIVETPDVSARVVFATRTELTTIWVERDRLERAVRDVPLPPGEGYIWAAGEASSIRALRKALVEERGWPKARIRAAAYWRRGEAAVHENFED
jgi:NADPH-dependent ferric siderophore reductase